MLLLVELLRLCLVSALILLPGAAPETLKDRTIKYRRKHQTRPIIECMRNGRTVMSCSVGELKVKGQKDEQELVIQEALASQLDL
ncbi:hypothetical protein Lalb_Chr00c24g0406821 (mitochondrion) [Lupinus albus]|uniref:Secreted protein n=1 Tax=Lupinus albus TaxID=3870 RepID=A0A6A4MS64_LUPAL|nr:hypothetical protein Lalb_Chr00c24g0406821 [Lupinus albus]